MKLKTKHGVFLFLLVNTLLNSNSFAVRNLAKVEDRSINESSLTESQAVPNNTNGMVSNNDGEGGLITYPVEAQSPVSSTANKVLVPTNNNDDVNDDTENHQSVLNELRSMTDSQRLQRLENIVENQKSAKFEKKIKQLQMELQNLRGVFEEKQYNTDRIIAQQKSLIEDLERKISNGVSDSSKAVQNETPELFSNTATKAEDSKNINSSKSDDVVPTANKTKNFSYKDSGLDQQALYSAAYESIKSRNYPKAIELFNKYSAKYPNGQFSASASYWVGEIYMIKSDYNKAISYFDNVLTKHPDDPKASDAMYKKALIYLYSKDFNKAKTLLADVSKKYKNTAASKLAEKQLKDIESISLK